jgi:hypothetical protein
VGRQAAKYDSRPVGLFRKKGAKISVQNEVIDATNVAGEQGVLSDYEFIFAKEKLLGQSWNDPAP